MDSAFDPYLQWLGIREPQRPPNHYRLLGVEPFEADPDVIANAADRQMAHVRRFQTGEHSDLSQRILNELAAARLCLLKPEKKRAYDAALRARVPRKVRKAQPAGAQRPARVAPAKPASAATPVIAAPSASFAQRGRRKKKSPVVPLLGALAAAGVVAALIFALSRQAREVAESRKPPPRLPRERAVEPPATPPSPIGPSAIDPPQEGGDDGAGATTSPPARPPVEGPVEADPPDDGAASATVDPPALPDPPLSPSPEPGTETADPPVVEGPVVPADPPARAAPPDPAARRKARDEVLAVYGERIADARKSADRKSLSDELRVQAGESRDSPNVQFALLHEAYQLALGGNDLTRVSSVIDDTAMDFDVDGLSMKLSALEEISRGTRNEVSPPELLEFAEQLLNEAIESDRYDAAPRAARLGLQAARRTKDRKLVARATNRERAVKAMEKRFRAAGEAREVLAGKPENKEANLALGLYVLLNRRDWKEALPLLKQGGDERYAEAARSDLASPADAAEQVTVGDAWWALGEEAEDDLQGAFQARALHWYRLALPQLKGFSRSKLEQRLAAAGDGADARGTASRGGAGWNDVIARMNVPQLTVAGGWELKGGTLALTKPGYWSRIVLPVEASSSYEVEIEFTADLAPVDAVGFILPVGSQACVFQLRTKLSGLSMVHGKGAVDNESTVRLPGLNGDTAHKLRVRVEAQGGNARVQATLDDAPLMDWQGVDQALSLASALKLPVPRAVGLTCNSRTARPIFHAVRYRPLP